MAILLDADGVAVARSHGFCCYWLWQSWVGLSWVMVLILDLVFIHYMDEQADTDGQKPISGFEFADACGTEIYVFDDHANFGWSCL